MTEENKILVLYVGVQGIRSEDIHAFTRSITEKVIPSTFRGEVIVLPVQSPDTRVECINPKYITEAELIKEHTEMMKNLKIELQNQFDQLKENNNG